MDELIDIVNKDGQAIGETALKSVVHTKGHYHNTAHIWLYTNNGHILLARRAANKTICPLLWDVSVAGHVDAGETVEQAAIRETKEELGLFILEQQLHKIGVFECFQSYPNGIIDNEFHHTYIANLNIDLDLIQFDTAEVAAIKLVSIQEFHELLNLSKTNNHFVASNMSYYKFVLDRIAAAIKN